MPDRTRSIPCPQCNYDLAGLIESWSDSPPPRATCSECGHSMDTVSLMVPERREPQWSFEHGPEGRIRRFFATWVRLLWPVLFWGSLPPLVRLRPVRLAIFVLLSVALCYAWIGSMAARNKYSSLNAPSPWAMMGTTVTPPDLATQAREVGHAALWPEQNFDAFWPLLRGWGALALGGSFLIPLAFLPFLPLLLRTPGATVALVRATLYQAPIAALLWTVLSWRSWSPTSPAVFWSGSGGWPSEWIYGGWDWPSSVIVILYTVWVATHWWAFAKRYARVRRPARVWVFVMFVSFGTMTLLLLQAECALPRIEIGMLLVDVFGQPAPGP